MDIDHFKSINDKYGHLAGDAVLRTLSDYLKRCSRSSDIVARIGGEEFAIIFPTNIDNVTGMYSILERMRLEIASLETEYEGEQIKVTCSLGVAMFSDDIQNADDLVKMADTALYNAKDAGRNVIKLFGES